MTVAEKPQVDWDHDGSIATEGEALEVIYALVRATKPAVCVETGTFRGHGTAAIVNGLNANERGFLYTIESSDVFGGDVELERAEFIKADSLSWCEQFSGQIDFAFVDCGLAEHRIKVLTALKPKMADGSTLCLHDTVFHGPEFADAAEEVLGPCALHLQTLHGLMVWRWR